MTKRVTEARPYGSGLDVMVHARFSAVLAAKLADLARAWGISMSETIRRLVEEAVREHGGSAPAGVLERGGAINGQSRRGNDGSQRIAEDSG